MKKPMTDEELAVVAARIAGSSGVSSQVLLADAQALLEEVQRTRGVTTGTLQPTVRSREGMVWADGAGRLGMNVRGLLKLACLKLREPLVAELGGETKVLDGIGEFLATTIRSFARMPMTPITLTALEKATVQSLRGAARDGEWPFSALCAEDSTAR